jgi:protein O-mannosyl-transferase
MFQNDFWGNNITLKDSHKSYRPLTTLTFALQRHFDGLLDSNRMKTVNLVIHVLNCCLMMNFFKAILADSQTQFVAVLMFSVHPVHVEAVCGIVSRSDLMACFTFLLSGILYFNVFHKGELS